MLVREWMTAPATTVAPSLDAVAALERMIELGFRRLPVEHQGKLVGIVTRGDLEAKLGWDRMLWRRLGRRVEDAMTSKPFTVGPEDTLEKAVEMMLHHRIGGIPVVESGRIVGIVTESDVFRAFVHVMAHFPAVAGS
ncbi:MAG TPA: CBS domain-containing protein [Planctomycetota bacterium]|nr:CBS domain-containing protein [Planctomycetota bacterium]